MGIREHTPGITSIKLFHVYQAAGRQWVRNKCLLNKYMMVLLANVGASNSFTYVLV